MSVNSAVDCISLDSDVIVGTSRNNAVGTAVDQFAGMQIVGRSVFTVDVTAMTVPSSMLFIFPVFDVSAGLRRPFDIFITDVRQFISSQIKVASGCDKAVFVINSIGFDSHIGAGKDIGRRAVQINSSVLHNAVEVAPGIIIISI